MNAYEEEAALDREDNTRAQEPRMTRAERRRIERGAYEGAPGKIGCKFCKSTRGTYYSGSNTFRCQTKGCKGAA